MSDNESEAWAAMNAFMEQQQQQQQPAKKKPEGRVNDPINALNFTGSENHRSYSEGTEYYKVGKLVKDIYFTMYPVNI